MVGGKRGFVGLIIRTKVRERNREFFSLSIGDRLRPISEQN